MTNLNVNELLYTIIINNNKTDFIKILESSSDDNNILNYLLSNNFYTNIVNNKISYIPIYLILKLNKIDLLDIIYNKYGFIGNFNYFNILFEDIFYSSFQIKKRIKLLEYLIEKKYNYKIKNKKHSKTIYQAKFLNIFKYNNNQIKITDLATPLHMLSLYKDITVIKQYLNYFIDNNIYKIDIVDNYNKTALFYAIELKCIEYCKLLINNQFDIYHTDIYNCNIFHYLTIHGNSYINTEFIIQMFKIIIDYNIDISIITKLLNTKNIKQYSPIDYILSGGKYDIFVYLENKQIISYKNDYITIVTDGYKNYNNYNNENSYQFKSYVKLTQLLLKNCMDFKNQDYMNNYIKHPTMKKLFISI